MSKERKQRRKNEYEAPSVEYGMQSATPSRTPSRMSERSTYPASVNLGINQSGGESVSVSQANLSQQDVANGGCQQCVHSVQKVVVQAYKDIEVRLWKFIKCFMFALYLTYVAFSIKYKFGDEGSYRLIVLTALICIYVISSLIYHFLRPRFRHLRSLLRSDKHQKKIILTKKSLYFIAMAGIITILIKDVGLKTPMNLFSLTGMAGYIFLCFFLSTNPGKVNFHPVYWGLVMQFYFAYLILRTKYGAITMSWLGTRVTDFLSYTNAGANFAFGDVTERNAHMFAFSLMPVVTFFSSFISILYYLGVMQSFIRVIGRALAFCLGTTPAESLNAAGNIFVGMTEAPLMIRPFIDTMTKSELHAVMTGGFATIAGSVFGAYIGFGAPADHLLAASVMSAPAALAVSKLMCPETEISFSTSDDYYKLKDEDTRNLFEAALDGATMSVRLIANIVVNVVAFLALLAFLNATLTWFGDRIGVDDFTFEKICSYVLYPIVLMMGTPFKDCGILAELIGVKTFGNEFIAYGRLHTLIQNKALFINYTQNYNYTKFTIVGQDIILNYWDNITLVKGFMTERGEVIATYALCGFSNFGAVGIFLGALTALAPHRRHDLSQLVFRAMIAGNISCFLTACIAGLFFTEFSEDLIP